MNYPTITFLVFTMFTGIVYFIVPKKLQWTVLLAASAAFFTLACGSRIIFLLAACAIIYIAALMLQHFDDSFAAVKKNIEKSKRKALKKKVRRRKKAVLTIAVICVLSMLLGIKYFNFFGSLINDITGLFGQHQTIPFMKMLMPLGISYYTLMGIGYMTDVFRGTVKAEKNPFMLLLYLCYFPHITEGPFDNYKKLCSQFREPHYINYQKRRYTLHMGTLQKIRNRGQSRSHSKYHIRRPRIIWRQCTCFCRYTLYHSAIRRIFRMYGYGMRCVKYVRHTHLRKFQKALFLSINHGFLAKMAYNFRTMAEKLCFLSRKSLRTLQTYQRICKKKGMERTYNSFSARSICTVFRMVHKRYVAWSKLEIHILRSILLYTDDGRKNCSSAVR